MRSLLLSLPLFAAIGCGVGTPITSITTPSISSGIQGKMYGGQQPIVGATVSVFAMNTGSYGAVPTLLGQSVLTDAYGQFSYGTYTCPANNPPVYILGQGGSAGSGYNAAIALTAGIGNCNTAPNVYANINEVTTAATAFALSHFFSSYLGGGHDYFGGTATAAEGNNAGLVAANLNTIPLLVSIPYGTANSSTATVTLDTAKLNSIANTLAACVNTAGPTSIQCTMLFNNTKTPGTNSTPSDVLQAATQMALYPYSNVTNLFNLAGGSPPFPGLGTAPADWTLGASFTAPNLGLSIAGSSVSGTASNIDIDATGRVWFPTNKASAHGVAYFDPATTTFSSVYGTGVTSPQYVAIDTSATPIIYVSDSASNKVVAVSTASPSAAGLTTYTVPGASTLGPIAISANPTTANAVLVSAVTSSSPTGFGFYEFDAANTTPTFQAAYTAPANGIAPYTRDSPSGYYEVEVSSSGSNSYCYLESSYADLIATTPYSYDTVLTRPSTTQCISGGVAQISQGSNEALSVVTTSHLFCSLNQSGCFDAPVATNLPVGIAVDGDRQVWVANSGSTSVSTFAYSNPQSYTVTSPIPYSHSATMPTPYGLAIDRSGNVWTSNAGCVNTTNTPCTPGSYVLSEIIGAAAPVLTPLAVQTINNIGDAVRPASAPVKGRLVQ